MGMRPFQGAMEIDLDGFASSAARSTAISGKPKSVWRVSVSNFIINSVQRGYWWDEGDQGIDLTMITLSLRSGRAVFLSSSWRGAQGNRIKFG
jgi:hypothetical protein